MGDRCRRAARPSGPAGGEHTASPRCLNVNPRGTTRHPARFTLTQAPARLAAFQTPSKPTKHCPAHHPRTAYLSARHLVTLVRRKGLSACVAGVAERIEADHWRWHDRDKAARVARHPVVGVIELMPMPMRRSSPSNTSMATPANLFTACPR